MSRPKRMRLQNLITRVCNMRCRLCAIAAPYDKDAYHPDLDFVNTCTDKLFELGGGGGLDVYELSGGEPFLRDDLNLIIRHSHQYYDNAKEFRIVTNGSIVPDDDLLEAMAMFGDKFFVIVNDYGELSDKCHEVAGVLLENGVRCELREQNQQNLYHSGFVDFGLWPPTRTAIKSDEQCRETFRECACGGALQLNPCVGGIIAPCPRLHLARYFLGIPLKDNEYVDLFSDEPIELKREKINHFSSTDYYTSCRYCNGMSAKSPRYMPAEQATTEEIEKWSK